MNFINEIAINKTFKTLLFQNQHLLNNNVLNYDFQKYKLHEIEDILYYCLHSQTNLIINNSNEFIIPKELSSYFNIIQKDNSIELVPNKINGLLKKNITVMVLSYNNLTYLKMMVNQMLKYTHDIVVVDNKSSFPPLIEYLKEIEDHLSVQYMDKNYGHSVYHNPILQKIVGPIYILTDPDIELPENIPSNFIENFYQISNQYHANRVGVALDIFSDNIRKEKILYNKQYTIVEWETQFWKNKLNNNDFELYHAPIDTTFCLINNNMNNSSHIRVAGKYMSKHLPWYVNWKSKLLENEYEFYLSSNISTNWCK
jgi:hypothetical protein